MSIAVGYCNSKDGTEDHPIRFKEGGGYVEQSEYLPLSRWVRKSEVELSSDDADWGDEESTCDGAMEDDSSEQEDTSYDQPFILSVPTSKKRVPPKPPCSSSDFGSRKSRRSSEERKYLTRVPPKDIFCFFFFYNEPKPPPLPRKATSEGF